jgi:hypothetical protein
MNDRGMRRRDILGAAPLLVASSAMAGPTAAPVLVELFTSQGCSSCPPADRLLGTLAKRPEVVALAFHVTYWDRLGWADTFGDPRFTVRQQRYADHLGGGLYTPEAVIGGEIALVGSDPRLAAAVDLVAQRRSPLLLEPAADGTVRLPMLGGGDASSLWAVAFDDHQEVAIKAGENAGRRLDYPCVVRKLVDLGSWDGGARTITLPAGRWADNGHSGLAIVAQRGADGRVLAIGRRRLRSTAML